MTIVKAASIDHINMNVRDLAESVAFYRDLFGFEVLKDQPGQDSRIIGHARVKLCLYENPEMDASKVGINHFGFYVENFGEVEAKLEEMGVKSLYGIVEWEESRSIYVVDPNGYEIELSEVEGGGL